MYISYDELFLKLNSGLQLIYGTEIDRIILYGSVARGTQTEESDIDIAVIIHADSDEMHNRMIDLIVDLELEYDVVLSVILINFEEFREWEDVLPFYQNVKKEGILLWKAA